MIFGKQRKLEAVLRVLNAEPGPHFTLDIVNQSGVGLSSLHVILAGLETDGIVTSEWVWEHEPWPRRRRGYQLMPAGSLSPELVAAWDARRRCDTAGCNGKGVHPLMRAADDAFMVACTDCRDYLARVPGGTHIAVRD